MGIWLIWLLASSVGHTKYSEALATCQHQPPSVDAYEDVKVTELRSAQSKAERLFHEVEARGLIRAGITESQLNQEIYDLAKEMYEISTYWHKRIVRAGPNTLMPYADIPLAHTLGGHGHIIGDSLI